MQDLPKDTECLWQQLISFTNVLFARGYLIKSQRLLKLTTVMYNMAWNKKLLKQFKADWRKLLPVPWLMVSLIETLTSSCKRQTKYNLGWYHQKMVGLS